MAARISIPVPLEAAETAAHRLASWLDSAESGDLTVAELDSGLISIVALLDEQRNALRRAAEH